MQWNLRMTAAERGIWKSTELRRLLAEAGLEISRRKDVGAVDRHARPRSGSRTST